MNLKLVMAFVVLCVSMGSKASIDIYEFETQEAEEKYRFLIKELRCPKCQNQDISDSNAPIAQDMRKQVHRLVEEGKTIDDIVDFMVERFGEFVSYRPVVDSRTYALWYGPLVLLVIGVLLIVGLARSRDTPVNESELNSDEIEKLDAAIKQRQSKETD